jgi:hypothetical protein
MPYEGRPIMFANQRRGSAGMESIVAVALVLLGWIAATGLLLKTYREGGVDSLQDRCEVVCRGADKTGANG